MGRLVWNDFTHIPHCGASLGAEARKQAEMIASRLDAAIATNKRVLAAVHTCPWAELNGHPLHGNELDILAAYSGNSLVGDALARRAAFIDLVICGHTHCPVRERELHGIPKVLNIGGDYGRFRGVI
jgi:hypothetical protein